jgi:phosphoglycerol transferase MdoB-like AlkP superfamily enzyme
MILKKNGYKTIFLKHSSVDLSDTKDFFRQIGFDEVHDVDIFKPEDALLPWGYPDNITYKRYFDFLESFKEEKLFVYMEVGSINHYPFDYYKEIEDIKVIIPEEAYDKRVATNLAKSMYLQDKYLGEAYETYFVPRWKENTTLLVFGDHPWPVGIHKNNIYNISNAFEENLLTSLLVIPSKLRGGSQQNMVIKEHYGNRYINKLILSLAGYSDDGTSISTLIEDEPKCVLSAQPFTQKKVIIKRYPLKYIIDIYSQDIARYNLEKDPGETTPEMDISDFKTLLNECK